MRASRTSALVAGALCVLCAAPAQARQKPIGIIASIGDTSAKPQVAEQMLREGCKWFRFNLAHKNKRLAQREAGICRDAAGRLGVKAPLLFDLPGGKMRTGAPPVEGSAELREGQSFTLSFGVRAAPSTAGGATVDYAKLGSYAEAGGRVLLHQGKIELEITGVQPGKIETRVVRGGTLRGHATVNLVGKDPIFPSMTSQDRRKLRIAVQSGADYIGVSMVQNAGQMQAVRRALSRLGAPRVKLVSKIETLSALENIDALVRESDLVMIARGDLATAVGTPEALRVAEEKIASACKRQHKPFIDATGFEGADAGSQVAHARALGPRYIMLKNTAIDADPVSLVSRLASQLR
jgi:pyruvate kinase